MPPGRAATRPIRESDLPADAVERGQYRHFMLKEIHEQPRAIAQTLEERIAGGKLLDAAFGPARSRCSKRSRPCISRPAAPAFMRVWSPATSSSKSAAYRRAWKSPANTAIAIRSSPPDTLFVTISQSGETADTLAALRNAKQAKYLSTLTICNVAESSMVRESGLVLLTRAGPEIGVASTKAFTTQLTALAMLTIALAKNGSRRRTGA
jgi:glucosamine--fructose-6-phosphate aminotransferase (isomerizing)